MPPVAGEERNGGEQQQAVDALRKALGEWEAYNPPVVHHEAEPLQPERVGEAFDPAVITGDRVVEVLRPPGLPEPGEIGRDAPGPLEEGKPLPRGGRHAVHVDDRRRIARRGLTPERGDSADVLSALGYWRPAHAREATFR